MSDNKRRALGRGLSALLPTAGAELPQVPRAPAGRVERTYFQAPIEEIHPSPEQPRRRFDETELDELAKSVTSHGIIQPLIVRTRPEGGYFLIAGERRWRAAQRAGQHHVPVVVQKVTKRDAFERAIVENVQRTDLNAIETADAYARLIEEFDYTQEQVAERVGKDRSSVANSLRLLKLPAKVREMVETNALSMGHARALLALDSPAAIEAAALKVIRQGLSVRATEKLARPVASTAKSSATKAKKSANIRDLEESLTQALGTQVEIHHQGKGGQILIRYADLDEFDRVREVLLR